MIFSLTNSTDSSIYKMLNQAMRELGEFYEVQWTQNQPSVVILPDRKAINAIRGYSTPEWEVAWADKNVVYILSKDNFEINSVHTYTVEEYYKLLKHELSHCYYSGVFANGDNTPIWLNEGFTLYTSGMTDEKHKPQTYSNFLDYYDTSGSGVYEESGYVVDALLNMHGKGKLLNLLCSLPQCKSKKEFTNYFKTIYGFELNYSEISAL